MDVKDKGINIEEFFENNPEIFNFFDSNFKVEKYSDFLKYLSKDKLEPLDEEAKQFIEKKLSNLKNSD